MNWCSRKKLSSTTFDRILPYLGKSIPWIVTEISKKSQNVQEKINHLDIQVSDKWLWQSIFKKNISENSRWVIWLTLIWATKAHRLVNSYHPDHRNKVTLVLKLFFPEGISRLLHLVSTFLTVSPMYVSSPL